jgi:hypothetical protein
MHVFTKDKIARSAQTISNGPAPRVVSHVPNFQIVHRVRLARVGRVVRSSRTVRNVRAVMAGRSGRDSRSVQALRAGGGEGFAGGRTQEVNNADGLTFRPELVILLTAQQ